MNARRSRFVDEYLKDLNATQAAIRAGYSEKTAEQIGWQLLQKTSVAAAIAKRQTATAAKCGVEVEGILRELARVGFSDMRHFTEWGAGGVKLLQSSDLTEEQARCVSEVSQTITKDGGTIRFKLHDKIAALTLLGKHVGLFPDRVVVDDPAKLSDEELQAKRDDTAKRLKLVG